MSYSAIYDAATDEESPLRKQVTVAIANAATDIFNENEQAPGYQRRLAWARQVNDTLGRNRMVEAMIWRVLENPTILANPAGAVDGDVQFVVNSLVNQFAGGIRS